MQQRIHDRIRDILEKRPDLTQKGLAEYMQINPAAVNRMLYGQRKIMAEEIPLIENYLGVHLNLSEARHTPAANIEYRQESPARRGFSDVPAQPFPDHHFAAPLVPVYGYDAVNPKKGFNFSKDDIIDWVTRHPAQIGIANAFAVYIFSDEMEPRYFQGELVYIHPGRPPENNRDCIIEMKNGEAFIRRFLRQSRENVYVGQFNPPAEKEIPREDIKAIYAVIGRN